jgi:type 1 fimbria pilin
MNRQVYLNSQDAYIFGRVFYFPFRDTMSIPPSCRFQLSVVDAQIPYSWYSVSENNNTIQVDDIIYTVPPGNYTVIQLLREIRSLTGCSTSYDSIYNKATLTFTTQVTLGTPPESNDSLLAMLGFNLEPSYTGLTFVSDTVVNLLGFSAIYLRSNFTTTNLESRTGSFSQILCKCPVNASGNGVVSYTGSGFKSTIFEQNLSGISLMLEDEHGHEIDLNGQPFQVTIQVDVQINPDQMPGYVNYRAAEQVPQAPQ